MILKERPVTSLRNEGTNDLLPSQLLQLQQVKQRPMALSRQEDKLNLMPLPNSDPNKKLIPFLILQLTWVN